MEEHRSGIALVAKLVPPTRRSAVVVRETLLSSIENAADLRLILLHAPAGYGKTSVLAQAHQQFVQTSRHAGWINLDEGDRDLAHFLGYLVDAIRGSGLSFGNALSTLRQGGASLPPETLKALLFDELLALEHEVYLFLDDYHLVESPEIRELINALTLLPFARVHFLVASRSHNRLPVARLRALGQLHELESGDLAFSELEVGSFVRQILHKPLRDDQITRLCHGTEGWAASLQMAGIALREIADVDKFLDRFSGERRDIGDFLGNEVLQRQPEALQEFLMLTSILPRFNSELCNWLTQRSNARDMLDEIEKRNLFMFSLDDERRWYRYHHLFSEYLHRRLRERSPHLLTQLHHRASQWLAEHGLSVAAIEHAFHAEDLERAGDLLDAACEELFANGRTSTLMNFSSWLPAELLDRLPRLQLDRAWHAEMSWKFDRAREALQRVEQVLARQQDTSSQDSPTDSVSRQCHLAAKLAHRKMMLALLRDDMPLAFELASRWLEEDTTGDPFMRASAGSAVLCAGRELYRCEGVGARSEVLQKQYLQGKALYGIVFHECSAGGTFAARGDLQLALEAYQRGIQMAVELQGEHSVLCSVPSLVASEIHYERDELDQAEQLLTVRSGVSELGFVDNLMAGFLTRGKLYFLQGKIDQANEALEDANWFSEHYGFDRMRAAVLNERLRQLLDTGHVREAEQLYTETRFLDAVMSDPAPAAVDGATTAQEYRILGSVRLWLAHGEEKKAAHLLRPWYAFVRMRHCHRSAIRIGALLSRAYLQLGDSGMARRLLLECLQMGERGEFVRSFVDEGQHVVEQISQLHGLQDATSNLSQDYTAKILNVFSPKSGTADPVQVPIDEPVAAMAKLREALNGREVQILKLGARGFQNADIAGSLGLAESTVKSYWQRIFDKFDVRRRSQAIRIARNRHLIS